MSSTSEGDDVACALRALGHGALVVIWDEDSGGDVVAAAEVVTAADVNFMAAHARGLVSLGLSAERVDRLRLRPMAVGWDRSRSAATRSIEATHGITTGISAHERAHTLRTAAAPCAVSDDLSSPGHVFPIRAVDPCTPGAGRVDAAVELVRRSGHEAAAAICTILDDDGNVARGPSLTRFVEAHALVAVRLRDVVRALRGREAVGQSSPVFWG